MKAEHSEERPFGIVHVKVWVDCNCSELDCDHVKAFDELQEQVEAFVGCSNVGEKLASLGAFAWVSFD